ncbi:MAG: glutaredoxin family protein [Pseudomonadota bacterium]
MPPVKMYSLSTCRHCKDAKKYFDECTIKYDFIDVDLLKKKERNETLEEIKKINPDCSFPTIMIGDKVVAGFKKEEIKEALGI